jgi:fatty acid desaturase
MKMLKFLIGMANTGDTSKPWLIAICMIVSIVVVAALFILGHKGEGDEEDEDIIE